jgi:glycosyltransferase involved in cell wall biosynthesis
MVRVLIAHPCTQHSFRVAAAFKRAGMLYKYVTTVYDKRNSFWMLIVKKVINSNNLARANRRRSEVLDDNDIIQFCELQGLLTLAILRLDKKLLFYHWWNKKVYERFQKKLAQYIIQNRGNIDIVISYDMSSDILFDILKRETPDILRIMDHAHPSRYYLHDVYKNIVSGNFKVSYEKEGGGFLKDKKRAEIYRNEILKADYHIVASTFSKQAAIYSGVSQDKIAVCPYGVDKKDFHINNRKFDGKLNVLFVGAVNQRKGIYQLLTVAKEINSPDVIFNIVGRGRDYCGYLYDPYDPYVNFHGHVSYEQLIKFYTTSHIFVFPTLGEGYGLVLLEALSAGLPLIVTPNCAGRDIVIDEFNGYVVDAGDIIGLKEKILWFKEHSSELQQMSVNAINSVKDMTWEKYEECLISIIINYNIANK